MTRRIAVLVMVGALAACSSSKGATPTTPATTPPTTVPAGPPTAKMITDVKAFMASDGKPLIEFEHATASMSAGKLPTHQDCLDYRNNILPPISKGPNHLMALALTTPDPALGPLIRHDIGSKFVVILACETLTKTLPYKVMPPVVRVFKEMKARLAYYDIAV